MLDQVRQVASYNQAQAYIVDKVVSHESESMLLNDDLSEYMK